MKRLHLILFVFIIASCSTPKRFKSSNNLFSEIAQYYPLSNYNIVLKTKDSLFNLKNPLVLQNGKLEAEIQKERKTGKTITFVYKEKSKNVVERLKDSSGNATDLIQFSKEKIAKVYIEDRRKWRPDHWVVYEKFWGFKMFLMVIKILILLAFLVCLTLFLLSLFAYLLVGALLGGCYIATMVYGSYDAPEVLVLRKFRDETLITKRWGRKVVFIYYMLSPHFVKVFKNSKVVNRFIKWILDNFVRRLIKNDKSNMKVIA